MVLPAIPSSQASAPIADRLAHSGNQLSAKDRAMKASAAAICKSAADIVGSRAARYGGILETHAAIAALWNGYLGERLVAGRKLTALDAALMMALLKIARAKTGAHAIDDYVDIAGYAGCAGEIAELLHKGEEA